MTEITEQRKSRLALFARDAVVARSDYQVETDAIIARTARLRAERLERDSVIPLPKPQKKVKAAATARKTSPKATVRPVKASGRLKAV